MIRDFLRQRTIFISTGLVIALLVILTAAFWAYTQDDVFITYTYSRNITQGYGFVFNPGERVQGTTTPLYTLLMAGVYRLTPDLLHAGNILSALFLLATCALAVSLTQPYLSGYARFALALTLVVSPLVYVSFGMETLFYCALLLLGFWLWGTNRRAWAMLIAALLTWTRADGVVLGGVFGLIAFWEARRRPLLQMIPWKLIVIYIIGIAPWYLLAWAYFGTPLPNTFGAKQEFLHGLKFWSDGWGWWQSFYGNNWLSLLAVPLIGLGIWRAAIQPTLRPLTLWVICYALGYTALNVTAFWYYTPLFVVLVILAACGGDWLIRQVDLTRPRIVIAAALALITISTALAIVQAWSFGPPPERVATYTLLGSWIRQNTDPAVTLVVRDLGIVGYHAQRRTLDSLGLVVPDMHVKEDEYAAAKYKPDYLIATQYWTYQRFMQADWFSYHYVPLAQFSTTGDPFSPMIVYRRRLALQTPPQAVQGTDLPLTCTVDAAKDQSLPSETHARLLSAAGDILSQAAHPFLWAQYPTAKAMMPETFIEQIALPLNTVPGVYTWELICDRTSQGQVEVLPIEQAPGYHSLTAEWPSFGRLQAAALPEGDQVWSGGSLAITLHWQALSLDTGDYSVFVHLIDHDGRVVAQRDGYPGGKQPNGSVIDIRRINLPPDLLPGAYRLEIGWYNWHTNERIRLSGGEDTLTLPFIIMNRWPGGTGLPTKTVAYTAFRPD